MLCLPRAYGVNASSFAFPREISDRSAGVWRPLSFLAPRDPSSSDPGLRPAAYRGGYSAVTAYIRRWRVESVSSPTKAFVPLSFELGEAFQLDWSDESMVVGVGFYNVQVAHLKLCASRAFWLVAYPTRGHEMLFDVHTRWFQDLGSVTRRGISDNMKTAIDKVQRGKQRIVSTRVYLERIDVAAAEAVVASHGRLPVSGQTSYDWQHYIDLVQRKPVALRNGTPFLDLPPPLLRLRQSLLSHAGSDRAMAQVFSAVPQSGIEAVLAANELVLEAWPPAAPSASSMCTTCSPA